MKKRAKRRAAPAKVRDAAPSLQLQVEQLRVQAVEDRIRLEQVADDQAKVSLSSVTEMLAQLRLGLERITARLDSMRLRIDVLESEMPSDVGSPFTTMLRQDGKVPPEKLG